MTRCRTAVLFLYPNRAAAFSASASTEGSHETLRAPTGAALLGWAAAQGRYQAFGNAARTIFHSGRVRFSNAVPLSGDGLPGWPTPQVLMRPKHGAGAWRMIGSSKILDARSVTVGRPDGDGTQREFIGSGFVTADGQSVVVETAGRLRTALELGSAKPNALFSLSHIEPSEGLRYAATIEADEESLDDETWRQLLDAFRRNRISLGRAAATAYGGAYSCEVVDSPHASLWPKPPERITGKSLRIWALSDLALVDALSGMPTLHPGATSLDLDPRFALDSQESAITLRRFGAWNSSLNGTGARDLERQLIGAGSVLTFKAEEDVESIRLPTIVGVGREIGLGRIWVQPPLLAAFGKAPDLTSISTALEAPMTPGEAGELSMTSMDKAAESELAWLRAQAAGGRK